MASSLAQAAAKGALFTLSAQASRIILQLASVVVLARMLSPHDYGLLAIVLVAVGFGEIFRDFGLTSASIQAPELTNAQRDNLFWVNALIGAVLASAMFCLSWPLSAMTAEPDLLGITQWLSLTFVLNGLATQHRANLMRDLKLRGLAVVDVLAAAIALAAAILAAAAGVGYWALVVQQLTTGLVILVGVVIVGRWLPRAYSRSTSIRTLMRFGWSIVATNLIGYASRQVDTMVVAMRFGTAPLGLYNRAYQLVTTPLGQVRSPLQSVALPLLSRVQQDGPRFNAYVIAAQLALGYLLGIPLAIVAGLAEPVVRIMLGAAWIEAAPMMQMFAIAGLLTTVSFVGYWVYLARGLGTQLFRYTMVTTAIKIVCIVIGSFFGVFGVAVAFAVHPAIAWPISLAWLSRVTPMPRRQLYQGASRIIAITLAAGATAWASGILTNALGMWGQAAIGTAVGLAVSTAFLALPVYRRDATSLLSFVRLMIKRDRA
ncbi:lipopolysaccharide biosynthesis protein [Microbacterium sp. ARD32]|uniref:lipopolysaccharide biosynthesis protein n=1 Tax=Microbacterium sp. ARD32 TaxID=2962577 RepID=UPI002881CB1A|nr:lipopolysaccharide biosynthesis protein [Microbacterium sp. ARD32]MDT0156346.1 lipopolysaccharide biosynthesis protein [Microbacterium sp. ARD32]